MGGERVSSPRNGVALIEFRQIRASHQPAYTGRSPPQLSFLELRVFGRAGIGDHVADVGHAGEEQ